MADEQVSKVSAAYRELGADEPPRALDDAILAAARRAAGARPGSPGRGGPNRWYAPLAAAAVLVLAVAVTLHLQSEQPEVAAPAPVAKEAAAPPAAAPPEAVKETPRPARPKAVAAARPSAPEPFPANRADVARGSAASAAGALSRQAEQADLAETPERALERIAELRKQGRHDEADQALAEFRKRYPDFKIPEETRARVERR